MPTFAVPVVKTGLLPGTGTLLYQSADTKDAAAAIIISDRVFIFNDILIIIFKIVSKFLVLILLTLILVINTKEPPSDTQKRCEKHFEDCDYNAKTRS